MGFELIFENNPKKSLRKLEKSDYQRMKNKIEEIRENPFLSGSIKLQGTSFGKNCYRIRVGNFRIVYDVDLEKKIILIVRVEKRENVYTVRENLAEDKTKSS